MDNIVVTESHFLLLERFSKIENPSTQSLEGLDDACFFCGAWRTPRNLRFDEYPAPYVDHDWDCEWIKVRKMFGKSLNGHTVKG